MRLTELCLRRPVLCTVLWLLPVFIGLVLFQKLSWRYTPQINQSKIQVSVNDSALTAQNMMTEVLIPIQNAIVGTEGISHMSATARQGKGDIIIDLAPSINESEIDILISELHNDIGNIENQLPDDISPKVTKSDDHSMPTMLISLTPGTHQAEYEFRQYSIDTLLPQLEQLPAAGAVSVEPSASQTVLININPNKVYSFNLSINGVIHKISDVNAIKAISGKTSGTKSQYQLVSTSAISNLDDIKNTIIATYKQQPIRLSQVADITIGIPSSEQEVKPQVDFSKKNGMLFILNPQYTTTANPLVLSQQVHELLNSITLPGGMKAEVLLDKSTFITTALKGVYIAIVLAVVLVAGVIWLFLGNMRITLIPIVTIPVCLSCSFIIIKFLGFSINSLTLLAMVLAVGLVVDDAIVVVENVHRQLRFHDSVFKATSIACRQIGFAIIATTLTLAAVYIPVGLVDGVTGQLFQQFAFTLAGTVIISGIVALTLSPMMCSKMMNHKPPGRFETWVNVQLDRLAQAYHHVLSATIDWRKTTLLVMVIIFASSFLPFTYTPSQMLPDEDSGQIWLYQSIDGDGDDIVQQKMIENMNTQLKHIPYIEHVALLSSNDSIDGFITLKPWEERSVSAQKISQMINKRLNKGGNHIYTGVIPAIDIDNGGNGNVGGINLNVISRDGEQKLAQELAEVTYKIQQSPLFSNARTDLEFDKNQFKIHINRVLASQYDVPLKNIQQLLKLTMSGISFENDMSYQGTNYSLYAQLEPIFILTPESLKKMMITNKKGKLVPMSALISIENEVGPRLLEQYDRATSASLFIRLADGVSMGEGIDALDKMLPDILPEKVNYNYVDEAKQYLDANQQMLFVFIAALIFIYMVLSAQFESVIDALVVMLSLPISLSVALWALYFSDFTLNVYSQIGLVTLIGLICKHGILITEFANELQNQGLSPKAAILKASKTRIRPILMTSLTIILGSLPLLWEAGPGAYAMGSIGTVIIAGMTLGIVDPLFVVPSVYLMMQRLKCNMNVTAIEN
ncbi:multidrug transporter [Photobacterium angustum]|uniref:efflux RND transporter permease subunit n=1 Tax=Photobacterium angustum TaxID=661 RepID=UPI0005EA2D98|nr:efflux RND transporter permease subunit [Photobacterium angustum]KJG03967.1 multidrug transporter [Photobacterium angustum]PSV87338.1 AcrB/AcrD/AcrF family protein [Photobacterium angustum]